ncbi:NigD-like C-terminal domain-containing protein [Prevotella sp. HUN102]|uniref:NigD1/NigD2 family lipoprotein n=1 Tax=Prevotella sp. HUN102 TaxID=1392486 RepID=UPI00049110DE|nr:NigD-like C-terminal domain-containing protein [Prevotella sp. HUN102]
MLKRLLFYLVLAALAACENNPYESGDSGLSYLRTDFVEANTNADSRFVSALTDDGEALQLASPLSADWATTPDSTYRALLYYNKKGETVSPIAISKVLVMDIKSADAVEVVEDPVKFNAAWLSKNRKYLNLGLGLKTGKVEGDTKLQSLGVVCDSVKTENGVQTHYLRLHHRQNGVPEYYTTKLYVSIPIAGFRQGDILQLRMNTYEGEVIKSFAVP